MVNIVKGLIKTAEKALGLDNDLPPTTGAGGVRHTPFTIRDETNRQPQETDTFLGALGKIGKVEAFGSATKGLNLVVKTANAGGPGLTNLINAGGAGVMKMVMGPSNTHTVLDKINRVNPNQVNKAVAHSNNIIDELKDGNFSYESVPKYTADFADLIKTGLRILKGLGKAPEPPAPHVSMHNYAKDLVDRYGGAKFPFRFVVTLQCRQPYTHLDNYVPTFLVKTCDRPQTEFDAEDINVYNIHTKVIKKTTFNPINMVFYDDQLSHVLTFCNMYLNVLSPTTNYNQARNNTSGLMDDVNNLDNYSQTPINLIEPLGGTIKTRELNSGLVSKYSASLGALSEYTVSQSLLESITIYHLYQGGGFCDIYKLINPKILSMQMDQLNHSATDVNTITLSWHYDSYSIQTYVRTDQIIDNFNTQLRAAGVAHEINPANLQPGSDALTIHNKYPDDQIAALKAQQDAIEDELIDMAYKSQTGFGQQAIEANINQLESTETLTSLQQKLGFPP